MGPTTRTITVTGNVTFDDVRTGYRVQAAGLIAGGADELLLETCQDTLNVKAARSGCAQALPEAGVEPAADGQRAPSSPWAPCSPARAWRRSPSRSSTCDLLSLGLNCATGPEFMTDHLRSLSALTTAFTVACDPNAGLPDEHGQYGETPESLASSCGASSTRAGSTSWAAAAGRPRPTSRPSPRWRGRGGPACRRPRRPPAVSGVEAIALTDDNRPLIVGERTNVIGSRKFKELIVGEQFEDAAEVGRAQVKARRAGDRRLPGQPRPRRGRATWTASWTS